MKLADGTAIAFCGLSFLFLIIGRTVSTSPIQISALPIPAIDASEPAITGMGFAADAVPVPTQIGGVHVYGSWVGGDGSVGWAHTRWYLPVRNFYMLVSGFPSRMARGLSLQIDTTAGRRDYLIALDENPDYWLLEKVLLPKLRDVRAFRIVAVDTSKSVLGWVGFSQPFTVEPQHILRQLKQLGLVILCTITSLVAFVGPGLVIRARWTRATSPIWLFAPGFLSMTIIGLFAWKGPSIVSPAFASRTLLSLIFVGAVYSLMRYRLTSLTTVSERRALGLVILLITMAVSKGTYSVGPSGELYRGRISRTLEVGARADSRIPYHIVQIIARKKGAYSNFAKSLLAPWNFSHRGPLAGIAVSPVVLASGAQVSTALPDEPWTIFDPQGFAAYRIAMISLSGVSLLVIFAIAQLFLDDDWAIFAFFVTATAPFTLHELFFTWPKVVSASFVLLCVYLANECQPLRAGLALGLGYLCHPSALLSCPFVLIVLPLLAAHANVPGKAKIWVSSKRTSMLILGLAICIVLWRVLNRGHFEQAGFIGYFRQAGGLPPNLGNWIWSRTLTALKTVVPFYLFLFHRADRDLIAVDGTRQTWVQFVQQYWCTLPFASGLLFFLMLIRIAGTAFRQKRTWMTFVFLPAMFLFILYFGAPNSGLMREGMHAWFFGFALFAVIIWNKYLSTCSLLWTFASVALVFRALEHLCVLVPFGSWSRGYVLQPQFAVSDLCCLFAMFAGSAYIALQAARLCRSLQSAAAKSHVTYVPADS